ncbi:polysaccharide biosynthesis protein [Kinneretia aquatilis]|uniref:polysaccharide biosynthesis protein n=1 Tax=Kinneretia aquatilis TaxID=2070761 RepID=UPI0014951C66|nr:nucleoside-diphosphate sugar epimerase/dehydratase [Paucibacter aquatile]WIV97442.1 nucleoside-diphosphate sugar epimerase/dehydratase [Paucibacter aquatile]
MSLQTNFLHRLVAWPLWAKAAALIACDAIALPLCMVASVVLRLGSFEDALSTSLHIQIVLALLAIPVLAVAGLYRSVLRFMDLRVLGSSGSALGAAVLLVYALSRAINFESLPRSSILIFWFIAFAYVLVSRYFARALLWGALQRGRVPKARMAIYGAGAAGVQLANSMNFSPEYKAVCFLDDDPRLQNKTVAGLPVFAPASLESIAKSHAINQVVLAIPSASTSQKRKLIAGVSQAGIEIKVLPGLVDLVSGQVRLSDIREVDVIDLLGRDAVPPDPGLFSRNLSGKVVLVTGAGGSIGSELCRQILSQAPSHLILLDHSEFSLYSIDQELGRLRRNTQLTPILGSVANAVLLKDLIARYRVQTIYHAAAYKHVPLVESNIEQGLRNNVFGTLNVAHAAIDGGVETCILVSTDKAVRPTNVMGATKRAAELIFQAAARRPGVKTCFAMVRFGNVLGSSGSVVPLFRRQIAEGGPITITHPEIIRYFMLIPEAAQLVIQAGAMAKGGDVFVLDMGEPVKIADLAKSMIRLSGLTERTELNPDGDIAIEFVGLRPGEKLYEELIIGDGAVPSGHPRIMCAQENHLEPAELDAHLVALQAACHTGADARMLAELRRLVPEFHSPNTTPAIEATTPVH